MVRSIMLVVLVLVVLVVVLVVLVVLVVQVTQERAQSILLAREKAQPPQPRSR